MAIELGAYGYMTKPFRVNELLIQVANALHRRRLEIENRAHRARLEATVSRRTSRCATDCPSRDVPAGAARLPGGDDPPALVGRRAARPRDRQAPRADEPLLRAARPEGRSRADGREDIRVASPMHDVGKIAIPDSILLKPGWLTPRSASVMEAHTEIGYKILAGSRRRAARLAADRADAS